MSNVLQQGWVDYEQGRYAEALSAANAILTLQPGQPVALVLKAMSQMWLGGSTETAIRALKKLQKTAPRLALVHHSLGTLHSFAGDMASAQKSFETALELEPGNTGSFFNLALVRKYERLDEMAEAMVELAERDNLPAARAAPLHFGLAKIFSDLGDHERAFAHVLKANALSEGHYNPKESERHLDSLRALRDAGTFTGLLDSGIGSAKPLFIVGMPRSGTSLTETILGRHSQVRACGELPDIIQIEDALTAEMGRRAGHHVTDLQALTIAKPADLKPHGEKMLKRVQDRERGAYRIFTDKMPPNGLRLGLIARLFPKAKVIVMRRDLRDCCVSNLFARLPATYGYTQRLDWLGHYARYFEAAVALWREIANLEVLDVSYEELVTCPEPVSRQMIEFAGLKWEPQCLNPKAGQSGVRTASVWQARQAINAGSVGRWRRYEPWLGPLLEALEDGTP